MSDVETVDLTWPWPIGPWHYIDNKLLVELEYNPSSPSLHRKIDAITARLDKKVLRRKPANNFYTLVCYLPLAKLLDMGLLEVANEIVNEMDRYLQRKGRKWNFSLFLDFTHVLQRCKWRGESVADEPTVCAVGEEEELIHCTTVARTLSELLAKYDSVATKWDQTYASTVAKFARDKDEKRWTRDDMSKIDLWLQFMKLIGKKPEGGVQRKIAEKYLQQKQKQKRNDEQLEHLYMLLVILMRPWRASNDDALELA
jgi:hypothetical protein